MSSVRSLMDPGGRFLARHLNHLTETLETFGARLREAVARAVGETVAGIVRETVHAVLAETQNRPMSPGRYIPSRPLWSRPEDEDPWFEDRDRYGYPHEEDEDDALPAPRNQDAGSTSRWPSAIAVGVHTTLWWLRRRFGRFPVLTAVAVGVLTAVATYAGGPLAAAAVGLAGSAFSLMSLAETVQSGTETLATFSSS